jgi:hypothetical protein
MPVRFAPLNSGGYGKLQPGGELARACCEHAAPLPAAGEGRLAPNGHEQAARAAGFPALATECSDDACWNRPIATAAAAAVEGLAEPGPGPGSACKVKSAAGVAGDWVDSQDVFRFSLSGSDSTTVSMTVQQGCGNCAFTQSVKTMVGIVD